MIIITTIAKTTVDAIEAGYNTNQKMADLLDVLPETIGSRCTRLRKVGLVKAVKEGPGVSDPLIYTVRPVPYTVSDEVIKRHSAATPKSYADYGEATYDNLNSYLYPQRKSA